LSIETVISPSMRGLVFTDRLPIALSTGIESQRRSRTAGVWRNSGMYCSRYTLMPPNRTGLPALTFGSSVVVGV
jgi:hypothetical protein